MELLLRILLFGFCLFVAKEGFSFTAVSVAVALGVYNLFASAFEFYKRRTLEDGHNKILAQKDLDHANLISTEKGKYISLHQQIIKDNNQTISKLVTLINTIYSSIQLDQQKILLESLVSEIDQQISYTKNLCDQYLIQVELKSNLKPLNDFKYVIVKQLQGKRPIKGIDFNKLLEQLQNLEDKINV